MQKIKCLLFDSVCGKYAARNSYLNRRLASLPAQRCYFSTNNNTNNNKNVNISSNGGDLYDVVIVGGGVSGTALLYQLSKFTNLKKLSIIERRNGFALVQSNPRNNSQTIHCGDIETNYTLEKAKTVKRQADMLRNYATKLPAADQERIIYKMQKMVIGVGDEECDLMEKRYHEFKGLFPNLKLYNKSQICQVEPRVGMKNSHSERPESVIAMYADNEHTAVNFSTLASSFVAQARSVANKQVDVATGTEVLGIQRQDDGTFIIKTNARTQRARFVVVSACGHSLLMAQQMGYGMQYSCLPVAGSYYFAQYVLHGKVYTVQNPLLPFAAVHGDPDVVAGNKTRFGPTALPLPVLERHNPSTFTDFVKVVNPDMDLVKVYLELMKNSTMRNYVLRNFLFEIPKLNVHLFLRDVQKIIPSLTVDELTFARGFGGIRPQLVDKVQKKLLLGEGKILTRDNIIFNITPSPGGTTCLGNSEIDMRTVCKALNAEILEDQFKQVLLEGIYPAPK